jgi:hypothetical protein
MAKQRKVLLVPHGKQGVSLEIVAHNLSSFSAVISAFVAVMVRKDPDIKDEMLSVLKEMRDTDGLSTQDRSALQDAVKFVEMLITKSEYIQ